LYTILTVIFLLCDFGMIVLTAEAMGMDTGSFQLPVDTSTLTAATLVTAGLFWGSIILDLLGVTHIGPWKKTLSPRQIKLLMAVSVFFIALTLAILVALAIYRYGSLLQIQVSEAHAATIESIEPNSVVEIGANQSPSFSAVATQQPQADSSQVLLLGILMGIAALSGASTVLSAVGIVIFCKFIVLLFIAVMALPLLTAAFITWLCSRVIDLIAFWVQMLISLFIHYGNSFLSLFGWRPEAQVKAEAESEPQIHNVQPVSGDEDPGFNPFSSGRDK
jgi:hypothetical protein